jgi:hypothetical protein
MNEIARTQFVLAKMRGIGNRRGVTLTLIMTTNKGMEVLVVDGSNDRTPLTATFRQQMSLT